MKENMKLLSRKQREMWSLSGMKNICPLPSLWETGIVKSYTVLRTNQKYVAPWNQRKMINNKNKNLLYMKVTCK